METQKWTRVADVDPGSCAIWTAWELLRGWLAKRPEYVDRAIDERQREALHRVERFLKLSRIGYRFIADQDLLQALEARSLKPEEQAELGGDPLDSVSAFNTTLNLLAVAPGAIPADPQTYLELIMEYIGALDRVLNEGTLASLSDHACTAESLADFLYRLGSQEGSARYREMCNDVEGMAPYGPSLVQLGF